MKLETKYHGILEYKKEDIITFTKAIPGFESLRQFIFVHLEDTELFSLIHSIEDRSVGFVVVSPFNVTGEYEINIDGDLATRLGIEDSKEVLIVNFVTLDSDINNITTNLRAPVVININKKLGEQIILTNEKYLIKHPIFKENK